MAWPAASPCDAALSLNAWGASVEGVQVDVWAGSVDRGLGQAWGSAAHNVPLPHQ